MAGTLAAVAAPGIPGRVRSAAAVAGLSAGVLGTYDDLVGATDTKGLKGHLTALRRGELTSGGLKVAGIGSAGLVAGAMLRRRPVEAVLAGGLIAGAANLFNLLDLRPGRALKAGLIVAAPYALTPGIAGDVMAGPVGAAVAVLPDDLAERSMLGDAGANAFGALVGVGVAASASRRSLVAMLVQLYPGHRVDPRPARARCAGPPTGVSLECQASPA